MLNSPNYVTLNGYIIQCYTIDVNQAQPLQFMSSLTPMELLNKEVQVQLLINDESIGMVGPDQY